jgi:hypothetical protein
MDVLRTYLPIHLAITYLHINYLPTYPPTHLHGCITYVPSHKPTTIHVLCIYIPTHIPTYILPTHPLAYLFTYSSTHPPISYNLPTFILHNLVVTCQNKHVK